jgi:hypothetical protein
MRLCILAAAEIESYCNRLVGNGEDRRFQKERKNILKKRCKHIDITDPKTVRDWVADCITRHKARYDFRDMLLENGLSKDDYDRVIDEHANYLMESAIEKITAETCRRIKERDLALPPVRIREQKDHTTGKVRMIGCESPMQQIMDYIAVYSCQEIFDARIVPQQCSSVPGRGQVYGMKLIRKYVNTDNRSIRYCKKHGYKYFSKCKYVVKLDIEKCFPSAKMEIFIDLFKHDCGNQTIVWLWTTLFLTHRYAGYEGFMIGSLISQWACQYMLSFVYREAMNIGYVKRNVKHSSVSHMIMFMDDMALFGSNREQLHKAVLHLITYTYDKLGFKIKLNYAIHPFSQVDMMGYVIYGNGTVSIRSRNYIKARRLKIRCITQGSLSLRQSKRMVSYKGFFKHSDFNKPGMFEIFCIAQNVISAKEKHHGEGNIFGTSGENRLSAAS